MKACGKGFYARLDTGPPGGAVTGTLPRAIFCCDYRDLKGQLDGYVVSENLIFTANVPAG